MNFRLEMKSDNSEINYIFSIHSMTRNGWTKLRLECIDENGSFRYYNNEIEKGEYYSYFGSYWTARFNKYKGMYLVNAFGDINKIQLENIS
jgi:hypothetical protein